ncbi:hypothetical protein BDV37DRAFT_117610 [Aspergillus pseudonomiae]|uniref:Uncharacterized protein n=1 Tax=Aspergillus pseudonomiae TaxID=1506151 RepID=A0A5N7DE87_9EURO|nr:uncharacterized protein BDV37DRAFT_117610 [Aspergillus pseudonomiae]KAE8404048.1 hypothetical protein BDV37DRAFT_117610 [Aspergillus pseudonomiae]
MPQSRRHHPRDRCCLGRIVAKKNLCKRPSRAQVSTKPTTHCHRLNGARCRFFEQPRIMDVLSRNARRSPRVTQPHVPAIEENNRVHMLTSHHLLDLRRRHTYGRPMLLARVGRPENLLRRRICYRVVHTYHTKKRVAILVYLKVVSNDSVGDTVMILCPHRLDKSSFSVIRAPAIAGADTVICE